MQQLSRRAFLATTSMLASTLVACQRATTEAGEVPSDDGVEITATSVRIDLAKASALARVGSALVIPDAHIMVLRLDTTTFRALSNVCTHAGCGIYQFSDNRMKCQCHGSEFDTQGKNIVGPAELPLQLYPAVLADNVLTITLA